MTDLQFKKTSGSTAEDFQAFFIETDYFVDEEAKFKDINNILRREISLVYKRWNIRFNYLTEAKMDYLLELKKEAAPQMILNSVTYNIRVEEVKARPLSGSITVINTVKE